MNFRKTLKSIGIIPVIQINDAEKAVPLALALKKGGLPAAEVTFRTDAAEEAIRRIKIEVPDVCIVCRSSPAARHRRRWKPACAWGSIL